MKIRSDSPFAKLTEDQCERLLALSKSMTIEDLCKIVEGAPEPIYCSIPAMRKFIRRLEKEQHLESIEDNAELVTDLSARAKTPEVREATLQAMRQRMFNVALESNNRELLMETFNALNAEKDKERAAELEERKVKVMEENARLGWRKLECENARAGLKALPRLREVLTDGNRPVEERNAAALEILARMEENPLLLIEPAREAGSSMKEQRALPTPAPSMEVQGKASREIESVTLPLRTPEGGEMEPAGPGLPAPQALNLEVKVGRNSMCPRGSGKKYKRCCEGKGTIAAGTAAAGAAVCE